MSCRSSTRLIGTPAASPLFPSTLSSALSEHLPQRGSEGKNNQQQIGPRELLAYRALLRARIRHAHAGGLDQHVARSSHGLHTLQGSLPRCGSAALTAPPLMGFLTSGASAFGPGPPGSHPQPGRLVSEETAAPPGLRRLVTITSVRIGRGSGVASSGPGVRHRPLSNLL
jgi:hypothetical protein